MAQERDIKYNNRTFSDYRQQLIDYAKNYFPDTYNDFSPTSPGMMFMEMAAYVGDVLSFYQDIQVQETFLQYAQEPGNLYTLAYMMGYRPKLTTPATVTLDIFQEVPADANNNPDYTYALIVSASSQIRTNTQDPVYFLTEKPVNFAFSSSYDTTDVSVRSMDASTNSVNSFLLKKQVKAYSAEIKTTTFTVTSPQRFLTLEIEDTDIIGILDVVDNNGAGNEWIEVPYLAQDTVFSEQINTGVNKNLVPNVLQVKKVPRRFVTRFTPSGKLQLQFGAGTSGTSDSLITPNPVNIGLGAPGSPSAIDKAYDPSNFMYTEAYGSAPNNTVLQVRYLVGGGIKANVPSDSINVIINAPRTAITTSGKENTLVFNNPEPATGGKDGDTVEEIRQNALKAYNEQLRATTREDYTFRCLSMPSRFGTIAKANIIQDQLFSPKSTTDLIVDSNPLSLSAYILAYDNNKKLTTASETLKQNLQTYLSQYKILTDAVNIKDAFIVNIGINYEIITRPNVVSRDVLMKCTEALKDHFNTDKWDINQPINISNIYTVLDKVKGVQTVQKVEIVNKVGGNYSQYAYDIKGATRSNIVYPSYDPCIFEVKYPNTDIEGRVTTL